MSFLQTTKEDLLKNIGNQRTLKPIDLNHSKGFKDSEKVILCCLPESFCIYKAVTCVSVCVLEEFDFQVKCLVCDSRDLPFSRLSLCE